MQVISEVHFYLLKSIACRLPETTGYHTLSLQFSAWGTNYFLIEFVFTITFFNLALRYEHVFWRQFLEGHGSCHCGSGRN